MAEQIKENKQILYLEKNQFCKKTVNRMTKIRGLIPQISKVLLGRGLKQMLNFLLNEASQLKDISLARKEYALRKYFPYLLRLNRFYNPHR